MNFTKQSGDVQYELWGEEINLRWKYKNFPESDPYFSVKQSVAPPPEDVTSDQVTSWLRRKMAETALLRVCGFDVEVVVDDSIYWSRDDLPEAWC